jgi:hypothetical protein
MMEDFTVETDDSISPFERLITDAGGIVESTAIKNRY